MQTANLALLSSVFGAVCMYVCMCVNTSTHAPFSNEAGCYAYIHIHIYIYIYIYTHTHTHIYIYTHTHNRISCI